MPYWFLLWPVASFGIERKGGAFYQYFRPRDTIAYINVPHAANCILEKENELMPRKTRKPATKMKSRLKVMGISQTALAKRLKKSVTLVNHFCVHGIKTVRIAKEYSRVLCCRPEELMDF